VLEKEKNMPSGIYKRKLLIKKKDKYNRLTAIKFSHKKWGNQFWLFRCDCGNEKVIKVSEVKSGRSKSCGCLWREVIKKNGKNSKTHGMSKTQTYKSWASMKSRCLNENSTRYENWGGRGIIVCEEWLKFENFYNDMGEKPEGKSLDRIDNNKGYYKKNCRWSTPKEQGNNTRSNVFITYKGRTLTMSQWAKEINISYETFWARIKISGWSIEKALNTKLR